MWRLYRPNSSTLASFVNVGFRFVTVNGIQIEHMQFLRRPIYSLRRWRQYATPKRLDRHYATRFKKVEDQNSSNARHETANMKFIQKQCPQVGNVNRWQSAGFESVGYLSCLAYKLVLFWGSILLYRSRCYCRIYRDPYCLHLQGEICNCVE
jgi:hypothetical protein